MKVCWYLGVLALFVSIFFVGCGGGSTPAPSTGATGGPPMPAGEKSPLTAGSAEEAEKMGRGPGRGDMPEGYRNEEGHTQRSEGAPPGGGGPPQ
jgi:hypothetical protein